jgi:hypothetical protein
VQRALNNGEKSKIEHMREEELQKLLLGRTSTGCVLGNHPSNGVLNCDIEMVRSEMAAREMPALEDDGRNRKALMNRLQLEEEYLLLELAEKDTKFDGDSDGPMSDPTRHLIDVLHLPMRTNEKVIHIIKMKTLDRRGGKCTAAVQALTDMDCLLRELGTLGETWGHSFTENNTEALAKSTLPYDQSRKIFCRSHVASGELFKLVDIAMGTCRTKADKETKKSWKELLRLHVEVNYYLSLNREYEGSELDILELCCDKLTHHLINECGGMLNVTNYFHDICAGHVVEQSRLHGNLWRFRNEGVESFNAIMSRRRNCFCNLGGAKRTREGEEKKKFKGVESLSNWCLRTAAWETGVGNECFIEQSYFCKSESVVLDKDLAKFIADDLGPEDEEYNQDEEWVPSSLDSSDDSDSDYGYDSEDLDHPDATLPPANNIAMIKTERRLLSPPTPSPSA